MNNDNALGQDETVHQNQGQPASDVEKKEETKMVEDQLNPEEEKPVNNSDEEKSLANTGEEKETEKTADQDPVENATEEKSTEVAAANAVPEEKPAGLNSEEDLKESGTHHDDGHEEHEEHEEEVDYSQFTKAELVEVIKELAQQDDVVKADKVSKTIKPFFDEIFKEERNKALEKFKADGGDEDDFNYRHDELDDRFEANLRLIRDKKHTHFKEKEKQKDSNLHRKEQLLEKLREFIDSDETNISFNKFKELQDEWKVIGAVPASHARTLWANYNALVNRFYDNRSIYFELKELDRKKNLKGKLELCDKAEALNNEENIKEAVKQLNELHHEFKHLGPVPQEQQEEIWHRFKAASDAIYEKRKDFVNVLKHQLEENLKKKNVLADQAHVFIEYDSDKIKEWNLKTKEILALQNEWEAIGGLPKEKAKDVNKRFWGYFKTFFKHKSAFFKRLDKQREENQALKQELVDKANELKDSQEWDKVASELKKLQSRWRDIGPVPEKVRDSIYKEFKTACDTFFNNKRENQKVAESGFGDNLKKKEQICEQITALAEHADEELEKFYQLMNDFADLGFVPKKDIGAIRDKQSAAVDAFIAGLKDYSEEEKQEVRLEVQISKFKNDPNADQKIYRKEQTIRRQVQKLENDISLWNNNMQFFAASKQADKVREEFEHKIVEAQEKLASLKGQLKMLRKI